jgi:HPt (histidine-containing phosphotransfer) domain-containing protein
MDAYVSKPVQAHELRRVIDEVVPAALRAPHAHLGGTRGDGARPPTAEVLDPVAALNNAGGDAQLLREIAELYLAHSPGYLADIHGALARGDAARLKLAAHTLKGSVGHFGAQAARQAAERVELLAGQGALAEAGEAAALLEKELERLQPAVAALRHEGESARE